MKQSLGTLLQRFTQTLTAAVVLLLASHVANATEISGVISVNGTDTEGLIIAAYDCDTLEILVITNTGPTEVVDGITRNYHVDVASGHVRLDLFFKDDETDVLLTDYCRAYVVCGETVPVDGKATVNYDMLCEVVTDGPGTASSGYWTNPNVWPVDSIVIGGITYTKAQAIALLKQPVKGDKTKSTFRELVAAKLNVAAGNDDSCIAAAIEAADAWMARHRFGSKVSGSSSTWKQINGAVGKLEDYNHGQLCAPPLVP